MDMQMFSSHVDHLREVNKMRTNQDRLMHMIQLSNARPSSMLQNGGGLNHGGGIANGGGLKYGNAGNGMAEFGQGYHPELRKIMKADDNTKAPNGENEEDAFVAVAETPVEVKKPVSKLTQSKIVTVQGTVKAIRTKPSAGLGEVNSRQKEVLQKAMAKAESITPFKARGNKVVIAIDENGEITKYKSLIKAHTALGVTKHQLFGGKTPKENYGSHYNKKLKKLLALVDKTNSVNFD